MMLVRRMLPAATAAALCASCAGDHTAAARREAPSEPIRSFDLVPRGYDDNCLALNPELGWAYMQSHPSPGAPEPHDPHARDPTACTWFFYQDNRSTEARPPCTSYPLDPDLGIDLSTEFELTCSDSPLNFSGHLNWGKYYGHAATFEGWLTWEGFSGSWPYDYDLNFEFSAFNNQRLGQGLDSVAIELDAREVQNLGSPWWRELLRKVHTQQTDVGKYVGVTYARVTGLLGIDAEHLSSREVDFELHPAFAMALRVACNQEEEEICKHGKVEHWALFARERGNQGLCSHWERKHILPLAGGAYTFRLPWRRGATGVSVVTRGEPGKDMPKFCSSGQGDPSVAVAIDASNKAALVTVWLQPNGIVDGDLYLQWQGPTDTDETDKAPPLDPRHRRTSSEIENPAIAQMHVDQLQKNPDELDAFNKQVDSQPSCKDVHYHQIDGASLSPAPKDLAHRPRDPPMKHVCTELQAPKVAAALPAPPPGAPSGSPAAAAPAPPAPKSIVEAYCEKRADKSKEAARFCRSVQKR